MCLCGSILSTRPCSHQHLDDQLARGKTIETLQRGNGVLQLRRIGETVQELFVALDIDLAVDGEHIDHPEVLALADLEVIEVVRRASS